MEGTNAQNYTFMLIIPKKVITDKIDEVHEDVGSDIRDVFIIPFALFSLFMMAVISYFLQRISEHITEPIIELFKKIQDIIIAHQSEKTQLVKDQSNVGGEFISENQKDKNPTEKKKEFNIMLNYKPRNKEINMLYLAFSNLTKTIKVARNSLYEGDDNSALLGYHEVAQIFKKLENQQKLGSCMNNLGCIYLKKDQFDIASQFLTRSVDIQKEFIKSALNPEKSDKDKGGASQLNQKDTMSNEFVKACRLYNKGLCCQKWMLKLIHDHVPNYCLSSFVKEIPD